MLGLLKNVGTVEAGKYADLIAVPGDPLTNISLLEDVKFVMKGGKVIKNKMGASSAPSQSMR